MKRARRILVVRKITNVYENQSMILKWYKQFVLRVPVSRVGQVATLFFSWYEFETPDFYYHLEDFEG